MSRYLILVLLNVPLVAAGILSSVVAYKLKRSSRRRFIFRMTLWLGIFFGIALAQPLYNFLFSHQLTETEPLSLFDVIQITGIILTLFIANRAFIKVDLVEHQVQDLHRELSIYLSKELAAKQSKRKVR